MIAKNLLYELEKVLLIYYILITFLFSIEKKESNSQSLLGAFLIAKVANSSTVQIF